MNKKKVTIAHLGARKHYQEPILLHEWGMLDTFYTDFYARNNWLNNQLRKPQLYSKLPKYLKKMVSRYTPELNTAKVVDFPFLGIDFFLDRTKSQNLGRFSSLIKTSSNFCNKIVEEGLTDADVIYSFCGVSLEIFEYAKSQGIKCILDQVIAERNLWGKLLKEEFEQWQNWEQKGFILDESYQQLKERETQEQKLAHHIICGSEFVKKSLIQAHIPQEKITVLPLAKLPPVINKTSQKNVIVKSKNSQPLNILFVGKVELRKGIPYLLDALAKINGKIPFTCKVVGKINLNQEIVTKYQGLCEFTGLVSRTEVVNFYQWADVFVFPSICEGSAMVTYEALMAGVPIITTENSGSIVRNGIDGYIVPMKDSSAIAQKLIAIYEGELNLSSVEEIRQYCEETFTESKRKLFEIINDQL